MRLRSYDRSRGQSSIVFDSLSLARVGDLGTAAVGPGAFDRVREHGLSKFVAHRRVERLLRGGITWLSDGKQKEEDGQDEKATQDQEAWDNTSHGGEIGALVGGGVVRKACGCAGAAAGARRVSVGPRTDARIIADLFD